MFNGLAQGFTVALRVESNALENRCSTVLHPQGLLLENIEVVSVTQFRLQLILYGSRFLSVITSLVQQRSDFDDLLRVVEFRVFGNVIN